MLEIFLIFNLISSKFITYSGGPLTYISMRHTDISILSLICIEDRTATIYNSFILLQLLYYLKYITLITKTRFTCWLKCWLQSAGWWWCFAVPPFPASKHLMLSGYAWLALDLSGWCWYLSYLQWAMYKEKYVVQCNLLVSASNCQSIFASNGHSVLLYMTDQCSRILVVSPSHQLSAIFVSLCFCDLSHIWKTYSLVIILSNQPGNCEYWKISPSVSSPPPSYT